MIETLSLPFYQVLKYKKLLPILLFLKLNLGGVGSWYTNSFSETNSSADLLSSISASSLLLSTYLAVGLKTVSALVMLYNFGFTLFKHHYTCSHNGQMYRMSDSQMLISKHKCQLVNYSQLCSNHAQKPYLALNCEEVSHMTILRFIISTKVLLL